MKTKTDSNSFSNVCILAIALSFIFITATLLVYYLLPNSDHSEEMVEKENIVMEIPEEPEQENVAEVVADNIQTYISEVSLNNNKIANVDKGLQMYRHPLSNSAVQWFYFQVTGNADVSQAIIAEADKNDIPLSLAFALAHTESNYKVTAVNRNTNQSIDRGLFQLNNNSFPGLTEEEFFDPYISAKYGMSHLRFCIDTAGNQVTGLAMYNAGTNKVRSNRTPQSTLNYVNKILAYQEMLDQLFEEQVVPYFEQQYAPSMTVALQY